MITDKDIIRSMEKLEKDGLFVSRVILTEEDWVRLGKPTEFQMAKVTVGEKNYVASAPEFFGYADIPLPPPPKKSFWRKILGY